MAYCQIHGGFDDHSREGCPKCQDLESQTQRDRSQMLESLENLDLSRDEIVHAINNPGDYQCPYCKFKTLLYEAACCPKCQRNIADSYWEPIRIEREKQRVRREEFRRQRAISEHRERVNLEAREMVKRKRERENEQIKAYFKYLVFFLPPLYLVPV